MVDPNYDYTTEYRGYDSNSIGIVGCGEIVESAQLPAYETAGFSVVGVTDIDEKKAQKVADTFDIEAFSDVDTLANEVDVIDIAVPPQFQLEIVKIAVNAGCHVLCQKPLALEFSEAVEIADRIEAAHVMGAVNQQMRWEKSMRAVADLCSNGELGTPLRASLEINIETDWADWEWMCSEPRLEVFFHSIHYLDVMRFLFGEPEGVHSTMAQVPDQSAAGETRTVHVLEYADPLRATIDVNHNNWADPYARFRFEGTSGVVRGRIGLFDYYPDSGPDTFEFLSQSADEWESHKVPDAWFPDAFIGTMGSLLEAIENGTVPPTHPGDNLETLRLANATYQSVIEGRTIDPTTVTQDHIPSF